MNTTKLEAQLLNRIAYNDYVEIFEGMVAADTQTWWWPGQFAIDLGISEKALGGVVASMVKKGLVCLVDEGTGDAAIWMTEAGFTAWRSL